jgi:hypothetical protein
LTIRPFLDFVSSANFLEGCGASPELPCHFYDWEMEIFSKFVETQSTGQSAFRFMLPGIVCTDLARSSHDRRLE